MWPIRLRIECDGLLNPLRFVVEREGFDDVPTRFGT